MVIITCGPSICTMDHHMFIVSTKKEECIRTYLHYYWFPGVREQVSNVFWKPAKWEINNLAAANPLNLKINNITHSHNQFRQGVQTFLLCLQTSIYSIKGRGVRTNFLRQRRPPLDRQPITISILFAGGPMMATFFKQVSMQQCS